MSNRMTRDEYFKTLGKSISNRDIKIPKNTDKNRILELIEKEEKRSKFGNKIIVWRGLWRDQKVEITFGSEKEANRGVWLIYSEKRGEICDLEFQKSFELIPKFNKELPMKYKADAFYFCNRRKKFVIEDTKSNITRKLASYINKRKLVKYQHPDKEFIEI